MSFEAINSTPQPSQTYPLPSPPSLVSFFFFPQPSSLVCATYSHGSVAFHELLRQKLILNEIKNIKSNSKIP